MFYRSTPRLHEHSENWCFQEYHIRSHSPVYENRSQIIAKCRSIGRKCSTSKQYISQITYLHPSITWNNLTCFYLQPRENHTDQFFFIACKTWLDVFGSVDKSLGYLFLTKFDNKSMREVRSQSKFESKLTAIHNAKLILKWNDIHHFEACWTLET